MVIIDLLIYLHWIVLTLKYEFAIQHDQMVILPEQWQKLTFDPN